MTSDWLRAKRLDNQMPCCKSWLTIKLTKTAVYPRFYISSTNPRCNCARLRNLLEPRQTPYVRQRFNYGGILARYGKLLYCHRLWLPTWVKYVKATNVYTSSQTTRYNGHLIPNLAGIWYGYMLILSSAIPCLYYNLHWGINARNCHRSIDQSKSMQYVLKSILITSLIIDMFITIFLTSLTIPLYSTWK